MARHSTEEIPTVQAPRPPASPRVRAGVSGAALIAVAVVLVIGAVALALVFTSQGDDAQGLLGLSMLVGTVLAVTRRKWL